MSPTNFINYYLFSSFRRKKLDRLLIKHQHFYQGIVLDIGGKDRGRFIKPKKRVQKWIFADLLSSNNPDLVLNVSNMTAVANESIDVINATELFEHVAQPEIGLKECQRVLKKAGRLIISVPFLYPIHADPADYQRWTNAKWQKELTSLNFQIEKIELMGNFFLVFCDLCKNFIMEIPKPLKYLGYLCYPLMDLIIKFDDSRFLQKNPRLNKYHGGYFIIAKKC